MKFRIYGATSTRGVKWVNVQAGKESAWARYSEFAGAGNSAMAQLTAGGVVIIGSKSWNVIRDQVARLRKFPRKPLIEKPGWTREHFAFPSGVVVSPQGAHKAVVLFRPNPFKCVAAGTLKDWRAGVAIPVIGQHLVSFLLMTTFAPPLLDLTDRVGNFGFEIVGEGGRGKSTLQLLMASACGGALPSAPGRYWINCNATANALGQAMALHADQPVIMEEAALFAAGSSERARGASFRELVFRYSDGTDRTRFDGPDPMESRFIFIMSSNKSLAEVLIGGHSVENAAVSDRLITLLVDDDRPHGIFDFLPEGCASGAEFAEALKASIGENYGLAFPRFIRGLVKDRSTNEPKLKRRIKRYMEDFRAEVGVNLHNGSEVRVIDAFGLSYAAGMLAKNYGVLPRQFKCMAAARTSYYRHRAAFRPPLPVADRLREVLSWTELIDLDAGLPKMSKEELSRALGFIRTRRSGRKEILLTRNGLDRCFPDWRQVKDQPDIKEYHRGEGDRLTCRRRVRKGTKKDALYSFLTPLEDD